MTAAPVALRVRFREAPAGDIPDLGEVLARDPRAGERLSVSSRLGASVAAVVSGHRADGRRIGLNAVGQEFGMPLATAQEGPGLVYGAGPFQWAQLTGRTRIADAWQLVESVRQIRGGAPVFVCISDQGFWLDGGGTPHSAHPHRRRTGVRRHRPQYIELRLVGGYLGSGQQHQRRPGRELAGRIAGHWDVLR